jgi:serine/threonine protein kinase
MERQTWETHHVTLKILLVEQLISEGDTESFLPQGVAREVFRSHQNILRALYNATNISRLEDHCQSAEFLDTVIGEDDDHALSNILATLLYGPLLPSSPSWKSFEDLCKQRAESREFYDGKLPLSKQEVREFLGEGNVDWNNFWHDQHMFSPVVLKKGDIIDGTSGRNIGRIPYLKEKFVKAGSHGRVFRVTLAGNHFGIGSNKRTLCARKEYDIANPQTFEAEWKHAELLSASKSQNVNILEIFAGLHTPTSLSFFCELADGDLEDFMMEAERPNSLADVERRLAQFNGIVRAVEFLHKEVRSRTGSSRESCFHLDLKPKNILVFNKGKEHEIFKISDFSISRSKNQSEYRERLHAETQKSVRDISTVAQLGDANTCLAPEAFGREGRVNASNDIWHIGCVLSMFIAWLYNGPDGLQKFNDDRYSQQQCADWFFSSLEQDTRPPDNEKEYWRQVSSGKFFIFRISLEVEKWLDVYLLEVTKRRPDAHIYRSLVKILKEDLLVADPKKRKQIENVRRSLDTVLNQFSSNQNQKGVSSIAASKGKHNVSARPARKR